MKAAPFVLALALLGCDGERLARLEKQNKDLQEAVSKISHKTDIGTQAKCAQDSETYFTKNWNRVENTIYVSYTNHFSRTHNKCFILIDWRWRIPGDSNIQSRLLYDVYENREVGEFSYTRYVKGGTPDVTCQVNGETCPNQAGFNSLLKPFVVD